MRFRHAVEVRFRDLDAMGHAHHTLPLIYFEEARAAYWREVAGRAGVEDVDYVIGEVQVRFHQRIRYPARLEVGARVSRIGGKSFVMEYELRSAEGELLATGRTVQVMYDYAAGRSIPVPSELKERILAFEGEIAGEA
ncbi:MAG TPA: thioesterase family protein [Longimicrobiales bacterium]